MKLLMILTALLVSQNALARVSVKDTQPIQIPQAETSVWTTEDVSKVIPTDLQSSSDGSYVATRIGDHALQSWMNSPRIKNSSLGRTAEKVQETMKTEVTVGGGNGSSNGDEKETEHRFSFQVLALQASSILKYTGWLNAAINFDARANETKVEVSEKVWNNKDFVLSHTANSSHGFSSVGLRWDW